MKMRWISRSLAAALAASLLALTPPPILAGPGAHGPNGEHLDAPAASAMQPASPRIEAASDTFELVGSLAGGELSLWLDRFASNEPVLQAQVEVESGGLKAVARFHPDLGDYVVDDPALLKKLSEPGEHALVISIVAGQDSDLLDAVLRVALPAQHSHDSPWLTWSLVGAAHVALLVLAGLGLRAWRRSGSAHRSLA